ncbi:MAG: hypothetical protein ABR615_00560 [Pseudonocardiaceae bacterium]
MVKVRLDVDRPPGRFVAISEDRRQIARQRRAQQVVVLEQRRHTTEISAAAAYEHY